jgi:endogenous inhibitor of DNA gyrase (YacG/DUF329 family)
MSTEKKDCLNDTCPYCGADVFVEETNVYKLHRMSDGTIDSKLDSTDLSVSCSNYNCEADLQNWIDGEIEKRNIHGITWME